jgi:hypothetical protein
VKIAMLPATARESEPQFVPVGVPGPRRYVSPTPGVAGSAVRWSMTKAWRKLSSTTLSESKPFFQSFVPSVNS